MGLRNWFGHSSSQDCANPFALRHFIKFLPRAILVGAVAVPLMVRHWDPQATMPPRTDWSTTSEEVVRKTYNGTASRGFICGTGRLADQTCYGYDGKPLARLVGQHGRSRVSPWDVLRSPSLSWFGQRYSVLIPDQAGKDHLAFDLPPSASVLYAVSKDRQWFVIPSSMEPEYSTLVYDEGGYSGPPALRGSDGKIVKSWPFYSEGIQFSEDGKRLLLFEVGGVHIVDLGTLEESWTPAPDGFQIYSTSINSWWAAPAQRYAAVLLKSAEESPIHVAVVDTSSHSITMEEFLISGSNPSASVWDDTMLLSCSESGMAAFFDLKTRKCRGVAQQGEHLWIERLAGNDEVGCRDEKGVMKTVAINEVVSPPAPGSTMPWKIIP